MFQIENQVLIGYSIAGKIMQKEWRENPTINGSNGPGPDNTIEDILSNWGRAVQCSDGYVLTCESVEKAREFYNFYTRKLMIPKNFIPRSGFSLNRS